MILIIKKPFEMDVELVGQHPSYLNIQCNEVVEQTLHLTENELMHLISFLNFSSNEFNKKYISKIDDLTLCWG